jgi:hypothetical protein
VFVFVLLSRHGRRDGEQRFDRDAGLGARSRWREHARAAEGREGREAEALVAFSPADSPRPLVRCSTGPRFLEQITRAGGPREPRRHFVGTRMRARAAPNPLAPRSFSLHPRISHKDGAAAGRGARGVRGRCVCLRGGGGVEDGADGSRAALCREENGCKAREGEEGVKPELQPVPYSSLMRER